MSQDSPALRPPSPRSIGRSMPRQIISPVMWLVWCILFSCALMARAADGSVSGPLRVVIIGGGPSLQYNQVAIESNVRYVGKLLPPGTVRTTLFADGDPNRATVLYDDDPGNMPAGERVLNLLLHGEDADYSSPSHYRKPNLGAKLDGASRHSDISRTFGTLSQEEEAGHRPLLLYFTGHGSSDRQTFENNQYDLWGREGGLTVRELAKEIARLPESTPVTIVMVQCFSGAFGNLVFEGGDPKADAVSRDFAGFFATVPDRVAAGCTSAVNEAEYHDFTSYFFAALTGRDRVGRRVTGADYNADGRVGMNEAYCYTLVNDESIDVPVCTSDVFLRRFVPVRDTDLFQTSYRTALSWANTAQHAALEGLSAKLHLTEDNRLAAAYRKVFGESGQNPEWINGYRQAQARFDTVQKEGKRELLRRYPDLRAPGTAEYRRVRSEASAQLTQEVAAGKWKALLDANDALDKSDLEGEQASIAQSKMLRFVRLAKSVMLAHRLEESGEPAVKARYAKLIEAEGRTLLPPAAGMETARK